MWTKQVENMKKNMCKKTLRKIVKNTFLVGNFDIFQPSKLLHQPYNIKQLEHKIFNENSSDVMRLTIAIYMMRISV